MDIKEVFITATRSKFRFPFKGTVSTEDLWDLNVRDLDTIYRALNAQAKQASEESLLSVKSQKDSILEAKIELIKYVVSTKLAEAEVARLRIEQREKKARIAEILADKREEELREKTVEELVAMLQSMEG